VCISCRRRGASCLRQDLPEDEGQIHTKTNQDALLDRMLRLESMLEKMAEIKAEVNEKPGSSGVPVSTRQVYGYNTPGEGDDSRARDPYHPPPQAHVTGSDITYRMLNDLTKLSEELVKAFPSQTDIDVFCKSEYVATFYCHQMFTWCGDVPENEAVAFINNIARIPDPTITPPVLVAKRMILFASFLQYFRLQPSHGLSEHPAVIMDRLVDTAVRLGMLSMLRSLFRWLLILNVIT
jgi:hypothetical protein